MKIPMSFDSSITACTLLARRILRLRVGGELQNYRRCVETRVGFSIRKVVCTHSTGALKEEWDCHKKNRDHCLNRRPSPFLRKAQRARRMSE